MEGKPGSEGSAGEAGGIAPKGEKSALGGSSMRPGGEAAALRGGDRGHSSDKSSAKVDSASTRETGTGRGYDKGENSSSGSFKNARESAPLVDNPNSDHLSAGTRDAASAGKEAKTIEGDRSSEPHAKENKPGGGERSYKKENALYEDHYSMVTEVAPSGSKWVSRNLESPSPSEAVQGIDLPENDAMQFAYRKELTASEGQRLEAEVEKLEPHSQKEMETRQSGWEKVAQNQKGYQPMPLEVGNLEHQRAFAHEHKEQQNQGKIEGTDYAIDKTVYGPNGKLSRPDFAEGDKLGDLKPIHRDKTGAELADQYQAQREKHVQGYEHTTGNEVDYYEYRTYPAVKEVLRGPDPLPESLSLKSEQPQTKENIGEVAGHRTAAEKADQSRPDQEKDTKGPDHPDVIRDREAFFQRASREADQLTDAEKLEMREASIRKAEMFLEEEEKKAKALFRSE